MSSNGKAVINISNKYDRVVALIDMDCFYCQVEEKLNPDLKGKPMAVVQYNTWQGGGIIAVNYAARAAGVTRHMRGNQAKEQCPEIELVHVPSVREKADLTKYREAGKDVANVLQTFTSILERASVDEAYLDITKEVNERTMAIDKGTYNIKPEQLKNTYAAGYHSLNYFITEMSCKYGNNLCQDYDLEDIEHDDNDISSIRTSNIRLLVGASIVNEIRAKVEEVTGFECSAGIAHNKILAKYACGINKPNKQTLFPLKNVVHIFRTLQLRKITSLGGKFGAEICEKLNVIYIGEVKKFSENELKKKFDEKNGSWLYLICRGIDLEAVTPRFCSKSIGCCKKFPGRAAIVGLNTLKHWLNELASEICDRLEKDVLENNRKGRQIVVNYIQEINGKDISSSRSTNLMAYDPTEMANLALDVIKNNSTKFLKSDSDKMLNYPVKLLGLSVGKFESNLTQKSTIQTMFEKQISKNLTVSTEVSAELKNNDNSQINKNSQPQNSTLTKVCENRIAETKSEDTIAIVHDQDKEDKLKNLEGTKKTELESLDDRTSNMCDSESYTFKESELLLPEFQKEFEYDELATFTTKTDISPDKNQNSVERNLNSSNYKTSSPASNVNLNQPGTSSKLQNCTLTKLFENQMAGKKSKNNNAVVYGHKEKDELNKLEGTENNSLVSSDNLAGNICASDSYEAKQNELLVQENPVGKKVPSPNCKIPNPNSIKNLNQPGTSFSQNYLTKYAEFQIPKSVEEDCILCPHCNQKVLLYELQTHADRHLAFQLSQQQREEYRKDMQKQFNSTPPNKKFKPNNKTKSHNIKSQINISRYLLKFNDESKENQIKCSECNCYIMKSKVLEHKDFHMAQKIQREWSFQNSLNKSSEQSSTKKLDQQKFFSGTEKM